MNKITTHQSGIGFDDEIAESFFYSSREKKVEIGFGGFYKNGFYCDVACKLAIKGWKIARSRLCENQKFQSLQANLGVVSLILSLEIIDENIAMTVNTVDNRYVEWQFDRACVEVLH